jgi:hypothetical protein
MSRLDDLASDMFDMLAAIAPTGIPRDDIITALGIYDVNEFHGVKGALQDMLGEIDIITVVGERGAAGAGWEYSLRGDPTDPAVVSYLVERSYNDFSRDRRSFVIAKALAAGIPGRTSAGRAALRRARMAYRSMEDTVDMLTELGEPAPALPPRL